MIGRSIGPYLILAELGGGMGEVYRARDTRLGRDVAVKILPAAPFTWSKPVMLFEGPYSSDFDVTADGSRFLMIRQSQQARGATYFNVIVNWFQELAKK